MLKFVDLSIQGGWLRRRGYRGRWITVYVHRYNGDEATERFHQHPWLLAVGIVLKGEFDEQYGGRWGESGIFRRSAGSIRWYTRRTEHRVVRGDAVSLFLGLGRTQVPILKTAEIETPQGYAHYTEIAPGESGYRPEFVQNWVRDGG